MNLRIMRLRPLHLVMIFVTLAAGNAALGQTKNSAVQESAIAREVRHQLVSIPYLNVFDNLEYSVQGTVVTLSGQVTFDSVKRDAENAVKSIEGVTRVIDDIEVLPPSPMDDQIRRAEFRAVYGDPALQRYAEGVLLPIRIIVKLGHVTLDGVVDSQADKNLAYVRANGVPGVFSVTNNLRVRTAT